MIIKVIKLDPQAILPQYMTPGSSGCDAYACLQSPLTILPRQRMAIPTGLAFEIPAEFEIQVRPRSGLSFKQGLTVVNAPGTIDSDYRGEVKILVVHLGEEPLTIEPGTRIAQLVLQKVERIQWSVVPSLSQSSREDGGFGSTGH
ncbi:MAG: dUTP diphosphatase [Deltaproteobacteria bacterium]|nr:dUTP diphosphatase [Deltaproteobacteria bacterium]